MKLCVHVNVLLLALGVISGQKCNESNECDSNSHLHLATKTTKVAKVAKVAIQISEFQPGSPGPPVAGFPLVELSGPPGDSVQVCVWTINLDILDPQWLFVASGATPATTATFDPITGLAEVPVYPDLSLPSFAIVLSQECPNLGLNLKVIDPHFLTVALPAILPIHDSIWVSGNFAAASGSQDLLEWIRTQVDPILVPGSVLPYPVPGFSPSLVFREGSTGPLFQVVNGAIFNASGTDVDPGDFDSPNPFQATPGLINPSLVGGATGDPHIHTLDGGHYTLLREGSFLLWRFGFPQPHVEWQIFAHYAGRQSFTKGLLLVDTSGPEPSSMEITSERCEWQTQSSSKKWSSVNSTLPEVLLSGPSSHMKLVGNQRKDMQKIELFIADEKVPDVPVATLKVMCRPGRHINLKLHMANEKWKSSVSGELKGQKGQKHIPTSKRSMLQLATREDEEFEVKQTWAELGGSSHAQHYLQNFDEHPTNLMLGQTCDHQAQADARVICQKHLGTVAHSSYLEECVYDVCAGGGEEAAEMTAEMLKF